MSDTASNRGRKRKSRKLKQSKIDDLGSRRLSLVAGDVNGRYSNQV